MDLIPIEISSRSVPGLLKLVSVNFHRPLYFPSLVCVDHVEVKRRENERQGRCSKLIPFERFPRRERGRGFVFYEDPALPANERVIKMQQFPRSLETINPVPRINLNHRQALSLLRDPS